MNIYDQCYMIWDVKESAALGLNRHYLTDLEFWCIYTDLQCSNYKTHQPKRRLLVGLNPTI